MEEQIWKNCQSLGIMVISTIRHRYLFEKQNQQKLFTINWIVLHIVRKTSIQISENFGSTSAIDFEKFETLPKKIPKTFLWTHKMQFDNPAEKFLPKFKFITLNVRKQQKLLLAKTLFFFKCSSEHVECNFDNRAELFFD